MKECIEREKAINAIRQFQYPYGVEFLLANIPTADVAEVRHGRWTDVGSLSCRCSECGCKNNRETAYCPACGALMDGKEADHD